MDTSAFLLPSGTLDFSKIRIDPAVAFSISPAFAARRLVLPLCVANGMLWAAAADTTDDAAAKQLSSLVGNRPVSFIPASRDDVVRQIRMVYGDFRAVETTRADGGDAVSEVEAMLRAAVLRRASDIHVDPERTDVRIRFRVDGVLEEFRRIPSDRFAAVASRIKVLAGLDIAERRAPQDGAFVWRRPTRPGAPSETFDVRVATLPVRFGERITLRLLETGGSGLTLGDLGMGDAHLASMERVLSSPHGLVLLTGPTGSGKSTTLYAAIVRLLEKAPLNVLTVEDPVEYEIPGVAQCEVDSSDKVSFGKALRSLLRHDPDVVMIGEIRDSESLDTAVKAALTGHLVLSTLHTNDSISAVLRLSDMGLQRHMIAATLRLVVAQRLVRRLCPQCHHPVPAPAAFSAWAGLPPGNETMVFEPSGCLACAGRGHSGRIGIFEFMEPDVEDASAIAAGVSDQELREIMQKKGFRSLQDDAVAKALSGEIFWKDSM